MSCLMCVIFSICFACVLLASYLRMDWFDTSPAFESGLGWPMVNEVPLNCVQPSGQNMSRRGCFSHPWGRIKMATRVKTTLKIKDFKLEKHVVVWSLQSDFRCWEINPKTLKIQVFLSTLWPVYIWAAVKIKCLCMVRKYRLFLFSFFFTVAYFFTVFCSNQH